MNGDKKLILDAIYAEYVRIESLPTEHTDSGALDNRRTQFWLDERGVRIDGQWIGSDAASRQRRHRALKRLKADGYITLHSAYKDGGSNATHAKLTEEGRKAVSQ